MFINDPLPLSEDYSLKALPFNAPRAMVASVTPIKTSDSQQLRHAELIKRNNSWEDVAWDYYDLIGEISIAANLIAATASRIRLFVGYVDDETADPKPVTEASIVPTELKTASRDALDTLFNSTPGGSPGLIKRMALNLFIAGDGYLVQDRSNPLQTQWSFQSTSALKFFQDNISIESFRGQPLETQRRLRPNDYFCRIYRPHPRYDADADSSLRASLDLCEELLLLAKSSRSTIRSRLNAGILLIPDELIASKKQEDEDTPDLAQDIYEALAKPLGYEDDPVSAVPTIITGPGSSLNLIKFLQISRAFDEKHQEQLDRVLDRILASLDIPKEVVAGVGELKYANSTQVEESLLQNHIQPLILTICDALTKAYLRPILESPSGGFAGDPLLSRLVIWYDPSGISARPDRESSSRTGLENNSISQAAWRRANGYSDNDAPTQTEIAQKIAIERGVLSEPVTEAVLRTLIPEILDRITSQNQSETGDTPEILNKLSSSPEDSTSNPQAPENLDLLGGEDDN